MAEIKVEKRVRDDIVSWKIPVDGITPNTVLNPVPGITLLVRMGNSAQTLMGGKKSTIYGLFNQRESKLFGGNKPYPKDTLSISAIDQNSFFDAEWGLAGPNAVKCFDPDLKVDCSAIARGKYRFIIDNFYSFVSNMPTDESGVVTKAAVREYFRAESNAVILSKIADLASSCDMVRAQTKLQDFSEQIKRNLNERFISSGLTVSDFVIEAFDYAPSHKLKREAFQDVQVNTEIKKHINEGRASDVEILRKEVEAIVPYHLAQNPQSKIVFGKSYKGGDASASSKNSTICPRCRTENDANANFCSKCGESLNKK